MSIDTSVIMLADMRTSLSEVDFDKVLAILHQVFSYNPRRREEDLMVEQNRILVILADNDLNICLRFMQYIQDQLQKVDVHQEISC